MPYPYITYSLVSLIALFILYKIFKKDKKKSNDSSKLEHTSEISEFKREYNKINSDISYVESQFNKYVIGSLESDLESFKSWISSNIKDVYTSSRTENPFWSIRDMQNDNFEIIKCESRQQSYSRGYVKLYVKYEWDDKECNFNIKSISSYNSDININGDDRKLKEIISKYFFLVKMESKREQSNRVNSKLNEVIKIIGKETVRDNRIDELLKGL